MTRRKEKQDDRGNPEDLVIRKLKELTSGFPFVLSVTSEMAGYFNSLGINIEVSKQDKNDPELVSFGNAVLQFLEKYFSENKLSFTWQVGIYHQEELISPILPGDRPLKVCPSCQLSFDTIFEANCPNCNSPI